jgi:hypothetical protein
MDMVASSLYHRKKQRDQDRLLVTSLAAGEATAALATEVALLLLLLPWVPVLAAVLAVSVAVEAGSSPHRRFLDPKVMAISELVVDKTCGDRLLLPTPLFIITLFAWSRL